MRDAIVVLVLLVAGFGALLAWHPLGRVPALLVALAGLLIAAGVYRARRPAFPLFGARRSGGRGG
jgi:ABC-type xylose transport system permease subunit